MPSSDAELVAKAQAGSLEAFDELVRMHQERVFALAYQMLGNEEDAADVQQDTFVRAWRSVCKFRQDSSFATWLHRIAVNLCLSRRRRRRPLQMEQFVQEALHIPVEEAGVACLRRTERVAAVRRAIVGLPAHYRVLVVLRDMEERPFEEIAEILGCSVASARTRASKARNILRERLKQYLAEDV